MSTSPLLQPPAPHSHYLSVAEQFLQLPQTRPVKHADIEPWRQGRDRYYCWCLEIVDSLVLSRIARHQKRLGDQLIPHYQRQPHLTLAICGFWQPSAVATSRSDDFFEVDLQRQLEQLEEVSLPSFELTVLGANSFASAPFLEVVDSPELIRLRRALSLKAGDFRSQEYCPHITLGLYHRALDISGLYFLVADPADRSPLSIEVSAVALMSYDSNDLKGPLSVERRVELPVVAPRDK